MESPCIDCICIPICKHKEWNHLILDCNLISWYLDEMEGLVSLGSYTCIDLKEIGHRYRIIKDHTGNCCWYKQDKFVGTSTYV